MLVQRSTSTSLKTLSILPTTVRLHRRGSVFTIGTLVLDVGAIERHIAEKWHIITLQEGARAPRARFSDESLPCDSLWRVRGLVQQGYLLLGHQGLFNPSPRHQSLRAGQDNRSRIRVCNTKCRIKSSVRPKIVHGHVSVHMNNHCARKCGTGKKLLLTKW